MKRKISCQLKKGGVQPKMIHRIPPSIHRYRHCTFEHQDAYPPRDVYAPQFVSFGLYHSYNSLSDHYKWCFLGEILNMNKNVPLEKYLKEMDRLKQKVKQCYGSDSDSDSCTDKDNNSASDNGNVNDSDNDIIKMLLLDGCCILGFLGILPLQQPQNDSSIITLWHHDSIRHDLLLMENQLPFIVLKQIYDLATERTVISEPHPLIEKVDETIKKLLKSYPLITNSQNFDHLLHCCHLKFKPVMTNNSSSNGEPTDDLQQKWRGATDLYKAGIKFKPKSCQPSESLLDVKFSERTLMIPTLKIEDSTSSVFRNLIAFEQSCTLENYFAAYAFFMGKLMGTPEDVTLLINKGVVENYIGANQEVSDFFNNLVKGVIFDVDGEHFLRSTFKDLNDCYNNKGHRFLADLKQNYCGSPWLVISVVAAAVILLCTVIQTVIAVIK